MRDIKYNKDTDSFEIFITVPRTQRGHYTYDEGSIWEQDAVCVWIDDAHMDYSLNHTQYLDYKDSLQATQPICFFYSKEEAEAFGKEHSLMIEYAE